MSVNPVTEDQIRDALSPFRADPARFETAVSARLESARIRHQDDPLAGLSPFLRGVAALLPLPFFTGCKTGETVATIGPATVSVKLLGYLAFPAISLFVLLGATIFGITKIRGIQRRNHPKLGDDPAINEAVQLWWRQHRWPAGLVFAGTLTLMWIGATWLLFLFYIISFGVVLYVLASFARLGLGNRQLIGQSCMMGLVFLGQLAGSFAIGDSDIHFIDQHVIAAVFMGGALLVLACYAIDFSRGASRQSSRNRRWAWAALVAILVVPLAAWFLNPIFRPATPERIKTYVESFHQAPYSTASWHLWEIVARWAIESKLDPDLSRPRRLLALEISGEQNPFILADAFSVGLIRVEEIVLLKAYQAERKSLFAGKAKQPILSLSQKAWVIRASVLLDNLTVAERDHLEQQLLATLDDLTDRFDVLDASLTVTRLLKEIDRPVDPARYRARIHGWLRKFQSLTGGGFQLAGGFKQYPNVPTGSVVSTSAAIELMKVYGIPDGLDLNWVRSFLKPMALIRLSEEKWIAAVALDRLNHLPGVRQPTWLEWLYYERSLIAALVLVGLCVYATLSSPIRQPNIEGIREA